MKRLLKILAALLVIGILGSCKLIVGPNEPAGGGAGGTLTISFGEGRASRAITSGADLPGDVLAGMRYDLILTGPNSERIERTVSGGETLSLTVTAGQWRIDSQGYYLDALAGTGSVNVTVLAGENPVRIPMMMSGPCYEVTVAPGIAHGAVQTNFTLAFEGTPITLTVTPDSDSVLKAGAVTYNDGSDHVITAYAFVLPASDVTVSAEFIQFVRYVRAGGAGNGTSWADASGDLQVMMDALTAIPASDYAGPRIVKAAAGTYKPQYALINDATSANGTPERAPAASTDRNSAFILRKGVQVWGGYPASGGDDASRNIVTNETILSGDIGAPNVNSDNAYHVVLAMGVDRRTVLSGLTITGGNADGATDNIKVFGYFMDANEGGGMYTGVNTSHSYSPVLVNVKISGNKSSNSGGGMYNYKAKSVLINVLVSGNTSGNGGGIINVTYSSPIFTNVTVSGNFSSSNGAVSNDNSTPIIRNSVIWGNNIAGVYNGYSTITISNSLVQGSTSTSDGNVADPGSSASDSPFVDWKDPASAPTILGDYSLNGGSPAVNAGDTNSYPDTWDKWQTLIGAGEGITTEAEYNMYIAPHLGKDLAGNTRIQGTAIDMGAYEKN